VKRLAVLAATLLVAGCGSSRTTVPPSAIAVVGDRPVSRAAFDAQLAQVRRVYRARGQPFPPRGTEAYDRLRGSVVTLLVEREQLEILAREHHISVGRAQIDQRYRRFKQTAFGGSEAHYRERLRRTGMTDAAVRDAIRVQLLIAALRKSAPAALAEQLPVAYAKGFAPANAG
jgi:hypothetical protein